jgi:hypothetical protein
MGLSFGLVSSMGRIDPLLRGIIWRHKENETLSSIVIYDAENMNAIFPGVRQNANG